MTRKRRAPGIQGDPATIFRAFVQRACELGADEAKIIDAATIATAPWVRLKCRFGCELYGLGQCCPPHSPTPEEMRTVIDCYRHALLFRSSRVAAPTRVAYDLEREIFLQGFYMAFGLGAGPCRLCRKCPPGRCSHPEKARPAMEACGIDVFSTARANGFSIEVLPDEDCQGSYFGLILID